MKPKSTAPLAFPLSSALAALLAAPSVHADSQTWGANANTAWYTGTNWAGGAFPGTQGNAASSSDIATFTSAATGTSFGINMNATSAYLNLGAISIDSTRTTATTIGNSSTTVISGNTQVLRLYGATVNGVANTILSNAGTGTLTIQNIQGSGTQFMGVVLSNTTDNIVNAGGSITVSSIISESASGNKLTKTGAGTLTLSGANSYTGTTSITRGTLIADTATNATVLNSSSALEFTGTGTFQFKGLAATSRSQTLNGLTLTKGAATIDANNTGTSTTLDLRGTGGTLGINRSAGATADFRATTGTFGTNAIVNSAQANDSTGILGAWATVNSGADWAVNNGSGVIVAYTGYNTLSGTTLADSGSTNYRVTSATTGNITMAATGTINANTLRINDATARTIDVRNGTTQGILRFGTVGGLLTSGGAHVIGVAGTPGTITAGGTDNTAGELILNNATTLTVNSIIANNGSGAVSLTKSGAGSLVLVGAHTYTGNTVINAGTLVVGITANTPATAASLGNGNYNGDIYIGSGATLSFRTSSTQVLSGIISGDGNFSTAGNAVTTLTGANTYTGTTTVAPQAAAVGGNVLSVSSINSVFTNPTLGTVRSASSNLGAPTTVANGTITIGAGVASSSTLRYTGTGETTDRVLNFSFNSGGGHSLDASNPSGLLKFVSNITGSRSGGTPVLTLTGTGNGEMAGNIPEIYTGLPVAKTGTGTWTLSGTNAYTGGTTVSAGVLVATKAASLPGYNAAAKVVFSGGTVGVRVGGSGWATADVDTLLTNATKTSGALGIDTTNGDLTQWTALTTTNLGSALGLTKLGTNKLTLDQANNYAGATSVNEGTLQVNAGGSLGAIAAALNMGSGSATTLGTVGNLTLNDDVTRSGTFTVRSNTATTTGANVGLLTIASGKTLTTGAMTVGLASGTLAGQDTRTALSTAGNGSLVVNGQLNMSQAGQQASAQVGAYSVLDLSGLASFQNNNSTGNTLIGGSTGSLSHSYARLTLANTSNMINAASLRIGTSGSNNSSLDESVVNLGAGTNTIQASTIAIGTGKAKGTLQFAGATGSVDISGTNGSGTAAITLGSATAGTYIPGGKTSDLLLAGHTATVNAGAVVAGQNAGNTSGAPTSSITFDTGTFNATSVTLASNTSGSSATAPTATFTVGGPTANSAATGVLTVTGDFFLASNVNSNASATGTATGSLVINGGTVNVGSGATNGIYDATTSTTGSSATTLTLAGGTLNLNGGAIGGTANAGKKNIGTLNFQSGTLKNVSQINNGAGLTKTTSGTLIIDGTNTYTGPTVVSAGVLAVNGSLANTSTTVNSGTLRGSGSIAGSVTVANGGKLAAGNSIESLGTGALDFQTGSTFEYELQTNLYAGTPSVAADLTDSTGTLDIASGTILTLTDLATSTVLADGSKLTLISYNVGGTAGLGWNGGLFTWNLATLADGATFVLGANTWQFDYNDTSGGPNYSTDQSGAMSFVTMTVVPEPGAALLGSIGLLLIFRRRR